jgi:hypothetical protein
MSYRVTPRQRAKLAAMRAAKERRRMEGEAPEYPAALPHLHRRVGWSRIVAEIRKVFPRVISPRSVCS